MMVKKTSFFIVGLRNCTTFAPLFVISDKKECSLCILRSKQHPQFFPGDTITVAYRIKEGNKERIQQYRGVVIKITGEGEKKRFTVRKISDNIGVERIFPLESPFIDSISINKHGKVRRAKLYYLRGLTGKKARIKERRIIKKEEA